VESFSELLRQGAGNAWIFAPSAILLGALHGLEPGHSKTLMAAFIVAVRGTVRQAILLGLAATFSHTLIVWLVALGGLYLWQGSDPETSEPYFQLASGAIVLLLAGWMLWRTHRDQRAARAASARDHSHDHDHDHDHGHDHGHDHDHDHGHHHDHGHAQGHDHGPVHGHRLAPRPGPELGLADAHARAHARQLERQLATRRVTTWQILLFGLTGGLIPCPAAITVLLLCLQLRELALGAALVLCFSIGLALTLVAVGVLAALGTRHAAARWTRLAALARRAPYLSGLLLVLVGGYLAAVGLVRLA
jgi:nickel/cobalt exporter